MEIFEIDDSFVSDSAQFDLTLIVDKHKIHVSKAVFRIASPVFHSMLGSDFKEKEQNEIELPGKNHNAFVSFRNCIYPDRMENVTSDTVYEVLPLAVKYRVNALIKKCHDFLLQLVKSKHLDNVMEVCRHIQLSERFNLGDLKQKSISIASEFPLEELEKASNKYPVTDDSLIKVHRQARMREELDRHDDMAFISSQFSVTGIQKYIEFQIHVGRCVVGSQKTGLQALRMCYRYFQNDLQLCEDAIHNFKRMQKDKYETDPDIEKEVCLLPEMVKQKLDLK